MQIPPDFKRAEIHGKANVIYNIDKVRIDPADPNSFCKCCGNPVVTEDTFYSICCNIENFAELGAGYTMYFYFKTYIMICFFILSIICGLTSLALMNFGVGSFKNEGSTLKNFAANLSIKTLVKWVKKDKEETTNFKDYIKTTNYLDSTDYSDTNDSIENNYSSETPNSIKNTDSSEIKDDSLKTSDS